MPATDLEKLVVSLSADFKAFERGLARAQGVSNRQFGAIEARARKLNRNLDVIGKQAGGSFIRGFGGAVAAGFSIQGAQKLLDTSTRITNALKVAGLEGDNLNGVYQRLYESAQRNAAPLESLVTLYGRASLVQKELGVSSEDLLGFTDNIALALRVAGTDAQSASGALLQLSQALGSGVVRAEEFNSILEGAPTILQAAAAGIKQAEGSVAKLRQIMLDGELSSRALFDGIGAGAAILEDKVAGSSLTISQALENLHTELINTAREFDKSTGASDNLAGALTDTLIPAIHELGAIFTSLSTGPIADFVGMIGTATDKVLQLAADLGSMTGLDKIGGNPYIGVGRIQERIDGAFAGTEYSPPKEDRTPTNIGTIRKPNAIDLNEQKYKAVADKDGKKGRSTKERADEYQRLTERIIENTTATIAETEAQRQLNPLINDYGYAAEKARLERELLTAAEEAGKEVTPELRAEISALADQYALAGVESAKLAESQDELKQSFEDMRDLGKDVMGGFISDLIQGKSASEALAGALSKVGDKLLEIAMNDLFGKSGSGGLGLLGSLLGFGGGGQSAFTFAPGMGLWADGGYTGDGGKDTPAGTVHKGEYVFSKAAVQKAGVANLDAMHRNLKTGYAAGGYVGAPVLPRLPAAAAGGSPVVVNFNPQIDARGASVEAVARLDQQMERMKRELPSVVIKTVRDSQTGKWKIK